jgi:aspartyl-tRNA synthetase
MIEKYDFLENFNYGSFVTDQRTRLCGEMNKKSIGEKVKICGWVNRRRDHGKLIFIDLRDFTGIIQIVFDCNVNQDVYNIARELRNEFVISVDGTVSARSENTVNPDIPTGGIEITADTINILSSSKTPPFILDQRDKVDEMTRLKYRYIDLRTTDMQNNLRLRSKINQITRNYLCNNGFIEVETPILAKSTPEGARDFLVPSRLNPGKFYALPQSPQLFKQILMFSGFDRIFQIARCFRDEDLRADRQPEFTQIDLEMSFIETDDVIVLVEGLLKTIFRKTLNADIKVPFRRLTWKESMESYGSDKPDLRFDLKLHDLTDIFSESQFNIFINVINKKGCIKGLVIEDGSSFTRKDLDDLTNLARQYKAGGLIWLKVEENGAISSPISKFLSVSEREKLISKLSLENKNLVLIVAEDFLKTCRVLGAIRNYLAEKMDLINPDEYNFAWVVDFPMFEWDDREKRFTPMHHPFTSPTPQTEKFLISSPEKVMSLAYDIILNGNELGGGSIRINRIELQKKIFSVLGFTGKQIEENFGFLIKALEYGAPPHGGIALGMDRLVMITGGLESIREVIAFPKTQSATCMMTDSPSGVTDQQLSEVYIKVEEVPEEELS